MYDSINIPVETNQKPQILPGRMGARARAPDQQVPARDAGEEATAGVGAGRPDAAAPAGAGRPGEEYDPEAGQEEGEPDQEDAGA